MMHQMSTAMCNVVYTCMYISITNLNEQCESEEQYPFQKHIDEIDSNAWPVNGEDIINISDTVIHFTNTAQQ